MNFHPIDYNLEQIKSHSNAEYKLFQEFIKLSTLKKLNWDIYYSYYYRKREKVDGIKIHDNNEIDFLVLAPEVGIFIIEVKGGFIKNKNGNLYSIDRFHKSHYIDPYNQAKNNYYGLTNIILELSQRKIDLRKFVSGFLVAFMDTNKFIEIPKSNGSDTYLSGMNLYDFILKASNKLHELSIANIKYPTKEEIKKIKEILDGEDFEYKLSKKDYIDSVNLAINDLTDEQFAIFRGLLKNKRCLINGKAGTGKTVISELLFKEFSINQKLKVLYLSYNSLISLRVKNDLRDASKSKVSPFMGFLEDIILKNNPILDVDNVSIEEKLKKLIFYSNKYITDKDKYDVIIIAEAQDIDDNKILIELFDKLLIKGLKDGSFYIFYDENQAIYYKDAKKIYENELFYDDGYRYAKFDLIKNCRNGEGVKEAIDNIFITKKLDESVKNDDVKFKYVKNEEKYALDIIDEIDNLIKDGINYNQITILVDQKKNNHILDKIIKNYNQKIKEFNNHKNNKLTYSTPYAFKGMENDVIIYISINPNTKFDLHYVALSRAKAYIYIYKIKK